MFLDNFYTRHQVAKTLLRITGGKVRTIGTISLNNVGSVNKKYIMSANEELDGREKGSYAIAPVHTTLNDKERSGAKNTNSKIKIFST